MKFLPYAFTYSLNEDLSNYSTDKIEELLYNIKSENIDFKKGWVNSGVGSSGKQNQLLNTIINASKIDLDVVKKRFNQIKQNK